MKKNIKKIIIFIGIVLLVVSFIIHKKNKGIEAEKIDIQIGDIKETVEGDCIIKTDKSTVLYAKGNRIFTIDEIFYKLGDYVNEGDIIFTTKDSFDESSIDSIDSQRKALSVQYRAAVKNVNHMKELYDTGAISKQEYDNSVDARDILLNQIKSLSSNKNAVYDNSMPKEVISPYNAKIVSMDISIGKQIMPQTPMIELADVDNLYIEATLSPKDAKKISNKSIAYFKDDIENRLKITKIHPQVENKISDVGIMEKKVVLDIELNEKVKSTRNMIIGMEDEIKFIINEKRSVIIVPKRAVFMTKDGQCVYKLIDGKAYKTKIQTGIKDKRNYEVLDGLKKGDIVIVSPLENLKDGTKIE